MTRYDKGSIAAIVNYSRRLVGKSLSQTVRLPDDLLIKPNRGDLGMYVEKYFFEHEPPNNHEPDFAEAELELKTTGVVKSSKTVSGFKPKERLVLSMINYNEIVEQEWTSSPVYIKCRRILLLCYLYEKQKPPIHRKFVLEPIVLDFDTNLSKDLHQLEADWKSIKAQVLAGRAHELSEGDTEYLGACTKASSAQARTSQPFSSVAAKPRAFSLKLGFMRSLIEQSSDDVQSIRENPSEPISDVLNRKFKEFVGMSVGDLSDLFGYWKTGPNHKGFYKELANRMMTGSNKVPEELTKSGTVVKTIRLEINGKPKESMSFPSFRYMEIVKERWEESSFAQALEGKFLFVVFQRDLGGTLRFARAIYWAMPFQDRMSAREVWEETQLRTQKGNYVYPGSRENTVAHVRPHARDKGDTYPTPTGTFEVKRGFWLNRRYIGKIISELQIK